MSVYVNGQEIKRIYVGGEGYIKKAYYGRNLVYEIATLFESGTPGTYSLLIDAPGLYEIAICGAGGGAGGSATSHSWMGGTGGTGAAFLGNVLLERGTYTLIVGSGGYGGSASGANARPGGAGTLSSITDEDGNVLITAGAGGGSHGTGDYSGGYGAGGTLTMGTAQVISYTIQTNGYNESTTSILGNGYGAGGYPVYHGSGTWGTSGYIRIKYVSSGPKELYAYYIPDGVSDEYDGCILYCSELITSTSGGTTGEKTVYVGTGTNLMDGIFQSYWDAINHPYTVNVTALYPYGFRGNGQGGLYIGGNAIRCPSLDIHTDGTVGNGGPNLFCYKNDYDGWWGYLPLSTEDFYNIGYTPFYIFGGVDYSGSTLYNNMEITSLVDEPVITQNSFYHDGSPDEAYIHYPSKDVTFGAQVTITISPSPSDAVVQLVVNGTTYTQNYIQVDYGTSVDWSVSKSGYSTETGTIVANGNITKSVELDESPVLYYCYTTGDPTVYVYLPAEMTTVGQSEPAYQVYGGGKATSSSQLINFLITPLTVSSLTGNGFVMSSLTFVRDSADDLYT